MWFVKTFCWMYLVVTAIMGNLFLLAMARNSLRDRSMIFDPAIKDWNSYMIIGLMGLFLVSGSAVLFNWWSKKS